MANAGIKPFDLERLFWGADPWGFYGEIIFRSVVMYLALLLLLRFMSKRALTQLSVLEFGIVIVLGSAAGDPTFYQEIPLFHGILVLLVIVVTQQIYTYFLRHNESVETAMEGTPVLLVLQGVIQQGALADCQLSQEELFELLRGKSVTQLGEIEAAYLEQSGQLSLFRAETPSVGLAIVPPWDLCEPRVLTNEPGESAESGEPAEEQSSKRACLLCGSVHALATRSCGYCGHECFTSAVQKGNPLKHLKRLK